LGVHLLRAVLIVGLLFAGGARGVAFGGPVESGRQLYEIYCRSCHGESGRGDGPAAETLRPRPSDLTRLSLRNDREFPSERVRRAIDGRDESRQHGPRRMPIWGLGLQELDRDANQEGEVRVKIEQLIVYLKSIQTDGD
jgi:hypothetical protein